MSKAKFIGRSSLSFDTPEGVLDIEDIINSNPWKNQTIFDGGEAGLVQRMLTEFNNKLTEQKQQKKSSTEKKAMAQLKENDLNKSKERSKSKLPIRVAANRSTMSINNTTLKEKMAVNPKIADETKNSEQKTVVKKTRNTRQGEGVGRKSKKDVDSENNGENIMAKKRVANATKGGAKITAMNSKKAKNKNPEKLDEANEKEIKSSSREDKSAPKKPRKVGERATANRGSKKAESNGTGAKEDKVTIRSQSKSKEDKENRKPNEKKRGRNALARDKKTGRENEKVGQRNKPTNTARNGRGRPRKELTYIKAESNSEKNNDPRLEAIVKSAEVAGNGEKNSGSLPEPSEGSIEFTPENGMTNRKEGKESIDEADNQPKPLKDSEAKTTETEKRDEQSAKNPEEQNKRTEQDSICRYQCQEIKQEISLVKVNEEPVEDSLLSDPVALENLLFDATAFQKAERASSTLLCNSMISFDTKLPQETPEKAPCASSTFFYDSAISADTQLPHKTQKEAACTSLTYFYDSAISSYTQPHREPRISIVARVKPILNETHAPVEFKYKLKIPLDGSRKGKNLGPKVMVKASRKKEQGSVESPKKSTAKREEKRSGEDDKKKSRGIHEQKLLDMYERVRRRRIRRHKKKAALAIEEFSRQIVKMAKKMGYLNGDSGSSSTSSSSSESSYDSSSDDSNQYDSDSSSCSCESCDDSQDFTEFSSCSCTSSPCSYAETSYTGFESYDDWRPIQVNKN